MNNNDTQIVSSKEAAEAIGVNKNTIYKYVKNNELAPINKETWHYDGGYYFNQSEIERFKETLKKPGLTTTEAAEILGVKPVTVFNYIQDGKLVSFQQAYKGRTYNFIREEDLEDFAQNYNKKRKETASFYSKEHEIALFQLMQNETERARVISVNDGKFFIRTDSGEHFNNSEANSRGFQVAYHLSKGKRSYKKGEVTFKFLNPTSNSSVVFSVFDILYRHVGISNMKVNEKHEHIYVTVSPVHINVNANEHRDTLKAMEEYAIEGKVSVRPDNSVILISNISPLYLTLKDELKERIRRKAKENNQSMDDYISSKLQELDQEGKL
ncbi:helix-turn-helix domain-containing protein [Pontibacillus halophilus]|uniref:helix-turn-helix domain-containing protein n=1 Tax=Pontibacillus halophilus TaxID=516704 RepID=UPI000400A6D6|nr:helix-turn-helix domain-containing protein [Pontibacillus halophilus]